MVLDRRSIVLSGWCFFEYLGPLLMIWSLFLGVVSKYVVGSHLDGLYVLCWRLVDDTTKFSMCAGTIVKNLFLPRLASACSHLFKFCFVFFLSFVTLVLIEASIALMISPWEMIFGVKAKLKPLVSTALFVVDKVKLTIFSMSRPVFLILWVLRSLSIPER